MGYIIIKSSKTNDKCKIDKFFHNSPGAAMCLGTPHFMGFLHAAGVLSFSGVKTKTDQTSGSLPLI